MKFIDRSARAILLGALIGISLPGCGSDSSSSSAAAPATHDVYFNGYVYDGADGTRLQGYTMEIQYRDKVIPGTVAADGRYLLGPIPVFQDYSVNITAPGYRVFRSHNAGYTVPGPNELEAALAGTNTTQTHFFDAYLFPAGLKSDDLNLSIRQSTTTGAVVAAGKIRLRAASASLLADTAIDTPSGVAGQLWTNDEDLQAKPVTKDIAAGKATILGTEIVYGVTYAVSIYDVPGYQPFEGTLVAGRDGSKTFALSEETSDPLTLLTNTASLCHPPLSPLETASAVVTFEFNQDIELSATTFTGGNPEIIDTYFTMTSPDTDLDVTGRNTLKANLSTGLQERGASVVATGKTLTLSWNPSIGLQTTDLQDAFTLVSYGGLSQIYVQPIGKPLQKVSMGSLYLSTINCFP